MIEYLVEENRDLKTQIKEFETLKTELKNKSKDFMEAKTIVTHEINILADAAKRQMDSFVEFRDETERKFEEIESWERDANSVQSEALTDRRKLQVKLSPPNFGGNEYDRPMQFLTDLKKYVKSTGLSDDCIGALLQQSLTKKAKRWFYTVEHRINSLEDFERVFKEQYWNEPIKSSLRTKFETAKLNPEMRK